MTQREVFDGGTESIWLARTPRGEVEVIDRRTGAPMPAASWEQQGGELRRIGGVWPRGRRRLEVRYTSEARAEDLPGGVRALGGGWYELPDGEKVQGVEAAQAATQALEEGPDELEEP